MSRLIYTFENAETQPNKTNDQPPPYEGQLEVQVQDQSGKPLSGVAVQIVRMRDNNLMYDLVTDEDGKTKRVTLTTPAVTTEFGQNSIVFYTNYMITLNAPGYYTIIYDHISIYQGSTMILILKIYKAR
jgi:5-hydroxyisourate hydrolase-like protein (transthyretin family)